MTVKIGIKDKASPMATELLTSADIGATFGSGGFFLANPADDIILTPEAGSLTNFSATLESGSWVTGPNGIPSGGLIIIGKNIVSDQSSAPKSGLYIESTATGNTFRSVPKQVIVSDGSNPVTITATNFDAMADLYTKCFMIGTTPKHWSYQVVLEIFLQSVNLTNYTATGTFIYSMAPLNLRPLTSLPAHDNFLKAIADSLAFAGQSPDNMTSTTGVSALDGIAYSRVAGVLKVSTATEAAVLSADPAYADYLIIGPNFY